MAKSILVPGWPWFTKDGQLYWGMQHARKADIGTFQPIGEFWGRDANWVYRAGSEMRDADVESFRVLNTLYAKDSRNAYTLKGPIADADVATFEVIGPTQHPFNTTNGYAKDSRHVYHTILGGKACVVKGADAATFSACGHGYGRDDAAVYFERKKIPGAKPATWRHLRGPHSVSGKNGYALGRRIRGGNGERLESLPILDFAEYWSRDDKNYYRWDEPRDSQQYLDVFRQCYVILGKVSSLSMTWNRTHPLSPERAESWAIADHAWISVIPREWLQKPDLEVAEIPKIGEPFRFGEGFHLGLLAQPTWRNQERIWIFRPGQDHQRVEKRLVLSHTLVWWEYSSLDQLEAVKSLIAAANSV